MHGSFRASGPGGVGPFASETMPVASPAALECAETESRGKLRPGDETAGFETGQASTTVLVVGWMH